MDSFSERAAAWRSLVPIILACFVVKCLVAWRFPFTGDEAYLVLWGKNVASGYYDHPPILGWVLHLVQYLGQSPVIMRLPPIIVSTAVAVGIYLLLKPYDERKAYLAFLLFILSPANAAFFIISTDTPLFLFSFFSVFALYKAEKEHSYLCYLLSGVFLGLAFLSKYFAVLLGFSYLLCLLLGRKDAKRVKGFLVLVLGALPFAAQNMVWNYQTGWPNVMHNLLNRFRSHSNPAVNLLSFGIFLTYLMTPPVLYFLFKNRRGILQNLRQENVRIFAAVSLVPLCIFFLVSFKKAVRPHWYLSFLPFTYVTAALLLDNNQLVKSIKFSFVFSLVQVLLVIAAPFAPAGNLKGFASEGDWASYLTHMHPQEVLGQFEEYKDRFVPATTSYCISALLEYYGGERFIVFGKGSRHGRQDDMLTDFKELDGRDIVILRKVAKYDADHARCFEKMEIRRFRLEGTTFTLLVGHGFKYHEYRERYLRTALQAYYQIPDWLPGSGSFFHDKYDF